MHSRWARPGRVEDSGSRGDVGLRREVTACTRGAEPESVGSASGPQMVSAGLRPLWMGGAHAWMFDPLRVRFKEEMKGSACRI